jgi:holo-[acyl-carrier protein] synthase
MFAKLADAGMVVVNYHSIKTFGDLLTHEISDKSDDNSTPGNSFNSGDAYRYRNVAEVALAVGIDMENIDAMPKANDFRENSFYKQNFSSSEISYCILQPNPYASFAGLFAAKEAIAKTDSKFIELPFSQIEIQHDLKGKPYFKDYAISISHTESVAVSVALNNSQIANMPVSENILIPEIAKTETPKSQYLIIGLAAFAFVFSLAALGLIFFKSLV